MSKPERTSQPAGATGSGRVDTEDIDSEWPSEPEDQQVNATVAMVVPKGPLVPRELAQAADVVDSERPEATVPAPETAAPQADVPRVAVLVRESVEKPVSGERLRLPARDPFVEKKSHAGTVVALISLGLLALFLIVYFNQGASSADTEAPPSNASHSINATPALTAVPPVAATVAKEPEPVAAPEPTVAAPDPTSPELAPAASVAPIQSAAGFAPGTLVLIESVPAVARVYVIEGTKWRDQGFTPVTLKVPAGEPLRVMIVKEGFHLRKVKVDGAEPKLRVVLAAKPAGDGPNVSAPSGEAPSATP